MSAHPRRRNSLEDDESHPDERWMASYMDMVTVLMALFIVLFAMSSVDKDKFEQLKNSLADGFGSAEVVVVDATNPVMLPPDPVEEKVQEMTDLDLATIEVDELIALREKISADLAQKGLSHMVHFTLDERGLTIGLIGSETYFEPDRADLSEKAGQVLDSVSVVLAATAREVSVEGHADRHGQTINFPTDWELSAGRASRVVRHLIASGGVPPERIAAVGYGAARPASTGSNPEDMAMNRRVDIVVLSDQPDRVRALIPSIVGNSNPAATR